MAGQPVHLLTESKRDCFRAENIGYIFQDFHLISSLTVRQNVELIMPRTWTKEGENGEARRLVGTCRLAGSWAASSFSIISRSTAKSRYRSCVNNEASTPLSG